MTDIDSNKVIEKLTEVLDLLKTKKEVKKEEDTKCEVKCVDEKCKCPFRKMMSEKEFEEFCKMAENMKKEDFVKVCSKGKCESCPFMTKKVDVNVPVLEEFEDQIVCQEQPGRECFQVINTILSLVLLILFLVFLFRTIKGLYCTV